MEGTNDTGILKRKKSVLTEDEYTKAIEAIIERDFFPDISVLKRKLQSFQNNTSSSSIAGDLFTVAKPSPSLQQAPTPAFTSTSRIQDTPLPLQVRPSGLESIPEDGVQAPVESLDVFLNKFTSEDNASFRELQEESLKKKRLKVRHLLEYTEPKTHLIEWGFEPRNRLFYTPDVTGEMQLAKQDADSEVHGPPKELCRENTRFKDQLEDPGLKLGTDYHLPNVGIVDKPHEDLLKTPTPLPGRNLTPIMTWGELAGTPVRLDKTEGPGFTIKAASERDLVARKMASSAKKSLQRRSSNFSPYSVRSMTATTPQRLSAAGRKLATKLHNSTPGTDHQLRAAYSGTPLRRSHAKSTPLPAEKRKTKTPSRTGSNVTSKLTQNLLD